MHASRIASLTAALWVPVLLSLASGALGAKPPPRLEPRSLCFGVFWPPLDPATAGGAKARALLNGEITLSVRSQAATGWWTQIRVVLSRPTGEEDREAWNSRLAFPEHDWMKYVRVWDADQRWLWPNLPYLLRLPGEERVQRYGGVDPGKGVDNDYAAVLIRKYDAGGQVESDETRKAPLVSAEWHPVGVGTTDKQTVIHFAQSDEFSVHLGEPGIEAGTRLGIWLIYADFMGTKPPTTWPQEPEYAGGILAYFEARCVSDADGGPELSVQQLVPRQGTDFDWARWSSRARLASRPSGKLGRSNDGPLTLPTLQGEPPAKAEPDGPTNGSQPVRSETNGVSSTGRR